MKAPEEGTAEIRHLDLRRVRQLLLQVAEALYEEGEPTSSPIVTSRAVAKIDFRLVPDQDPEEVFEAFARAVAEWNPRAEVRRFGATAPSFTDPTLSVSETVIGAVRDSRGTEPVVSSLGGTLPDYVFTQILGVPSMIVPYANHDEQNHALNENLRLDCFFAGIRTTLHILDALRMSAANNVR